MGAGAGAGQVKRHLAGVEELDQVGAGYPKLIGRLLRCQHLIRHRCAYLGVLSLREECRCLLEHPPKLGVKRTDQLRKGCSVRA